MKSAKIAALVLCAALPLTACDKEQATPAAQAEAPSGLAGVRAAIVSRNFGEAVELAAAEVKAHPQDPQARFEQARAEALSGNEGRALDALDKAVSLGLPDAAHALEDPAFAQISNSERFVGIADRASPSTADKGETLVAGNPHGRAGDGVAIHESADGTHIQAGDVKLDTDF